MISSEIRINLIIKNIYSSIAYHSFKNANLLKIISNLMLNLFSEKDRQKKDLINLYFS